MARRSDLCKVADAGAASFERLAGEVFAVQRRRLGDHRAAELLLSEGWSNGYLYLTAPEGP
jgi:hypothetical protein